MAQYFYDLKVAKPGGDHWPEGISCIEGAPSAISSVNAAGPSEGMIAEGFTMDRTSDSVWLALMTDLIVGDGEVLLKMRMHRPQSVSYYNTGSGVMVRSSADGGSSGEGYYSTFGSAGDKQNDYLCLYRRDPGGHTNLYNYRSALSGSGNDIEDARYLRCRFEGSTIKIKGWWEGGPEPSSWAASITDSSYASGLVGIMAQGYDALCSLIFLGVGTGGDPAPSAPLLASLEGTITEKNGNPAARQVAAYYRSTGQLAAQTTSDEVTGAFTMTVDAAHEYSVVALGVEGGGENALVFDRITPVTP